MQVYVGARGPQVAILQASFILVFETWSLTRTRNLLQSRLDSWQALGILLAPFLLGWDYRCAPPCLPFYISSGLRFNSSDSRHFIDWEKKFLTTAPCLFFNIIILMFSNIAFWPKPFSCLWEIILIIWWIYRWCHFRFKIRGVWARFSSQPSFQMESCYLSGSAQNTRATDASSLHSGLKETVAYKWGNRGIQMLSEVAEPAAYSQPIRHEEEKQLGFKTASCARLCNVSDSIPVCALLWLSACQDLGLCSHGMPTWPKSSTQASVPF